MQSDAAYDVIIIGAGIVGLAVAHELAKRRPAARVLVLDKEDAVAQHQSGRNSGVLHSGIYYAPGSAKARNCVRGHAAMISFCREHGIAHDVCGKVIVAVDDGEREGLHTIFQRGQQNGVRCELVDRPRLRRLEPAAAGVEAIWVPQAGIVDYPAVCARLVRLGRQHGHELQLGQRVIGIDEVDAGIVVKTAAARFFGRQLVACAGLYSDRVARASGAEPDAKIVPFRGEYYRLVAGRESLCRNLIYPVPDPRFPFLGVHLTRMVDGTVECGPNAVLAFAREGYGRLQVDWRELAEYAAYPGLQRLFLRHWRPGLREFARSWSKRLFVNSLRRLVPDLVPADVERAKAGVRAQALRRDGSLVDDFEIVRRGPALHVINAPSPAATSSLAIAEQVVSTLQV
ncbi:MAG: L-2-hydroxyglutarate oxidase [Myxococcales bacterium FL481]|nr:MAG: L-2-hydroxyglutarate oxidase [Myxococcales bacterium FL481]